MIVINNKTLTTQVVNFHHNACNKIIPISDTSVILFSFDREIFNYTLSNEIWSITNTISNELKQESTKEEQTQEPTPQVSSVLDRLKKFDLTHQLKKNSTLPQTNGAKKISHNSTISSSHLVGNELLTTDISGFIKIWKL